MGAFEEELTENVKWCLFRNVDDIIQMCFYPFLMNRMCHCEMSSASVLTHCFLCGFCPNTPSGDKCRILLEGIICHKKTVDNVRTLICFVHFFILFFLLRQGCSYSQGVKYCNFLKAAVISQAHARCSLVSLSWHTR